MKKRPPIKIELTAEQQKQIQSATDQKGMAEELTPEVLEERIAPTTTVNASKSVNY